MAETDAPFPGMRPPLAEIAASFLKLGCISFGGPVAHLGYLRDEFVVRRRWLDDDAYGSLVALCQFLPGPASSQVVLGLGMRRAGLVGALLASVCFTLPSALLMIGFGYGVMAMGDLRGGGWLHGLKVPAVAVVAQAVWGMGRRLCPDLARPLLKGLHRDQNRRRPRTHLRPDDAQPLHRVHDASGPAVADAEVRLERPG